jgi:vitamin B12 transporter
MKRLITLCIFTFFACSLFAQSDTTRYLPSAEVIAQRLNFFTIGQTQMQSDSFTLGLFQNKSLSQFLQSETPLSIKAYGTGAATLSARGMAANHTAVLWNGINLQNALNGNTDLAIVDMGVNQRIGVKLGGCSALCGSGAIAGIVNMDNEKSKNEGFHGQLAYGFGSVDRRNPSAQFEFNHGKIGASLRVSSQSATNDFVFRNTADIGQPLRKATHSAYDFLNISGNVYVQLSPNDFLSTHFWQSRNYREITPTMTAANNNAIYCDTANRLTTEWTHFFKKSFLKVRGAVLKDKNFYESDVTKNSQNGINSYIGEAEWNYNFTEKHRFRMGANTTSDHSDNNNYKENKKRNRLVFFVNDAIKTDFITLSGNIRQEWIDGRITPTTFSTGFEKHFIVKNAPKNDWILRGALSRNFNVPTFNDLYWPNLGNPNLVNEQGWSKELGLSFKHKAAQQRLETHLTFFDIDIKNRIVWLPQSSGQWQPTNLNQVTSKGVETWVNYTFLNALFQYKVNVNYQYADAKDGNGGVQLFVPKHKGGAGFSMHYRAAYFTWQQTASGKRYSTTDQTAWTKPFTTADASVGFTPSAFTSKKRPFNLKTDIRLSISNVFNADYEVIRFYPNPRRQYNLDFLLTL